MIKKLSIILMSTVIFIGGSNVSFAASSPVTYAETDNELIEAEIDLNNMLDQIKKEESEQLESILNENVLNSEEEKMIEEEKNDLEKLETYEDFDTIGTVEDAKKMLEDKGYPIDKNFISMCKEIEEYKNEQSEDDLKEVVKYFNSEAGLKEKNDEDKSKLSFNFGVNVCALSYSDWTSLTSAEKLLIASDPKAATITNSLQKLAFDWTQSKFGYNGLGDKSDGYRHGVWNALMTRDISRSWAKAYATAHEDKSQSQLNKKASDGWYEYQHRDMDLHNNQIGRDQIASYEFGFNCSDSTIKSRISAKLTNSSSGIKWLHN